MEGKYSYVNHTYANCFRHVNDNFVGKDFFITMHVDDIEICSVAGRKALANPDILIPVRIRKHDGKGGYVITQWEFKGIFDGENKALGVFCLGYDITDFINELEDQNALLDDIAFSQSHVVRRPLANMLGALHLLSDIQTPLHAQEMLEILKTSAKELDDIIRKISDDINN